jgi:hypothetical protein
MNKKSLLLALILISLTVKAEPLSQNDVSILMPLPVDISSNHLWNASVQGSFGELLPRKYFDKLPELDFDSADETFKKLRVVAVRIDPCFPDTLNPSVCNFQIRLVWQPVAITEAGSITTIDAALHTFYDLNELAFKKLIKQLEQLKSDAGETIKNETLSIHPLLKSSGLSGSYAKELFSILLSELGSSRLSRITFMQLSGSGNVWNFGGFDIVGNGMKPMLIPRVNTKIQAFNNNPHTPTYFQNGGAVPSPRGKDTFNLLIQNSRNITNADEPEIIESTMSAARVENPKLHNPHTIDCVSCHTAQPARIWAQRQYPWLMLDLRAQQFEFSSTFNLKNSSPNPERTTVLRAFGYDGDQPAISQRTINETAAVLEYLKRFRK